MLIIRMLPFFSCLAFDFELTRVNRFGGHRRYFSMIQNHTKISHTKMIVYFLLFSVEDSFDGAGV